MTNEMQAWRRQWDDEGYILVRGVLSPGELAPLRDACERILAAHLAKNPETGKPGEPNGHVMRHLNRPEYAVSQPGDRLTLLEAVAKPQVLAMGAAILGGPLLFRCTSLWYHPQTQSTDGNWHRDSQFGAKSEADEKVRMFAQQGGVQMQLALIPTEDNEFVPRSQHRWDTPEEYQIRLADGQKNAASNAMPGAVRLAQQPGDILGFNPMGLHRGRYHSTIPRRTLMLTYTTEALVVKDYFSKQPWCLAPDYLDGLSPAARAFFERFIAAYGEFWRAPA